MARLADFVAVIRVLRTGPVSVSEIAKATRIRARTVYRLLKDPEDAGARLQKRDGEFEASAAVAVHRRFTRAPRLRWTSGSAAAVDDRYTR